MTLCTIYMGPLNALKAAVLTAKYNYKNKLYVNKRSQTNYPTIWPLPILPPALPLPYPPAIRALPTTEHCTPHPPAPSRPTTTHPYKLTFNTPSNGRRYIYTHAQTLISTLYSNISETLGIKPNEFYIMHNTHYLRHTATLRDYNILEPTTLTIHYTVATRGGAPLSPTPKPTTTSTDLSHIQARILHDTQINLHATIGPCEQQWLEPTLTAHNLTWSDLPQEHPLIYLITTTPHWDLGSLYLLHHIPKLQAIRLSTVGTTTTTRRYITPTHIWTCTIPSNTLSNPHSTPTDPTQWTWHDPTPTPLKYTNHFRSLQQTPPPQHLALDFLLTLRHTLTNLTGRTLTSLQPPTLPALHHDHITTHTGKFSTTACPTCNEPHHTATWRITRAHPTLLKYKCGSTTRTASLTPDPTSLIFNNNPIPITDPPPHHRPDDDHKENNPRLHPHTLGLRRLPHTKRPPRPKAPLTTLPSTLKILSWNSDRTLPTTFRSLLAHGLNHGIDVITLQETQTFGPGNAGFQAIENSGYIYITHPGIFQAEECTPTEQGKVATLLRTTTAGRLYDPTLTWFSPTYHSMGITLQLGTETLLIATSYLPTAIDNLPPTKRTELINPIHDELLSRSFLHSHAILTMDANETTHADDRTHKPTTPIKPRPPKSLGSSTMACYSGTFRDAHHITNPLLYRNDGAALPEAHTHFDAFTSAKLDRVWITKCTTPYLQSCSIHNETRSWSRSPTRPRTSYHTALITTLHWPDIWTASNPTSPPP